MNQNQQKQAISEWVGLEHDYPNCLNAMHEAEERLDGVQQREYLRQLYYVAVELEADKAGISTDVLCNEDEMYIVASASAKERSEALCRTLWPERFETK